MDMDPPNPCDTYVDKLPSPPRLAIPPLAAPVQESRLKAIPTKATGIFKGESIPIESCLNMEWGRWEYSNRYQAQQILPCLWLGPFSVARSPGFLSESGITFILAIRYTKPGQTPISSSFLQSAKHLNVATHTLDVTDNQSLIASFPAAINAVNSHLQSVLDDTGRLGTVLICCPTGNELSAAVTAAYLMDTTELTIVPVLQFLQMQRFCLNLDDAMKHTLQAYEDIVKARGMVAQDASTPTTQLRTSIMCNIPAANQFVGHRGSKRTLDDGEDERETPESNMTFDENNKSSERTFAPFT